MENSPFQCRHFAHCGGCDASVNNAVDYVVRKQQKVAALAQRLGIDASTVQPMVNVGNHSRRRASFRVAVEKGVVRLGFNAARSHDVVDMQECVILAPEIFAVLAPLRECLASMKKPGVLEEFRITKIAHGLDVSYTTKSPLKMDDKAMLLQCLTAQNAVRVCENGQRVAGGEAVITLSNVPVSLPPEAFLQASEAAQIAMQSLVREALLHCTQIVDLYSGCGTFSLALAKQAQRISAYEGSPEMIAALHNAALQHKLPIHAQTHDLYKHPLTAAELQTFDGAVINPPHNGASPQCGQLAVSNITKIVMVSCNPATFERDAKALLAAGYTLTHLTPVDQFYGSNHLELVACFTLIS